MRRVVPSSRRRGSRALAVALGALLAGAAGAEPRGPAFRKGGWNLGVAVGWGDGLDASAGIEHLAVLPRAGFTLAEGLGAEGPLRGSLELVVEGAVHVAFEPESGHAEGLGLLLRYDFLAGRDLVPYVEAGAGIGNLDFGVSGQRDGFAFTLQGGVGLHWLLGERLALTLGYRLHHFSNAYTRRPNEGIDSQLVLIGLTVFRD